MKHRYRTFFISTMLILPVLCLAGLLTLTHRSTARLIDSSILDSTALDPQVASHVQTLAPRHQGTGVLPLDDVTITKTANVQTARVGTPVEYDVVIENSSNVTVTADVTDALPDELRLMRVFTGTATLPIFTGTVALPGTNVFSASTEIAPMSAVTLMYKALVRSLPVTGSTLVNTVTAEISVAAGSFIISDTESITVELSSIPLPIIRTASLDLIENGGFEAGSDGSWAEGGSRGSIIVDSTQLPAPITPHGGDTVAWLGGFPVDTSLLIQSILVPNGYREIYLQYHYWIESTDSSCGEDIYTVGAFLPGGTGLPSNVTGSLCTDTNTSGWETGCLNLASANGQTVDITFVTITSDDGESSLFIDDVSVEESCTATAIQRTATE